MKIIVIVGSGSGCGKTTIAGRVLRAIPGLGAAKISPREGPTRIEWGPGTPGKDTDLYAASGAAPVARIIGPRDRVLETWQGMSEAFAGCRGVVIEGTPGLDLPGDRYLVFVGADGWREKRPGRNAELALRADVIIERSPEADINKLLDLIRIFLQSSAMA